MGLTFFGEGCYLVGLGFGCALEIMSTKVCMVCAGILLFSFFLIFFSRGVRCKG